MTPCKALGEKFDTGGQASRPLPLFMTPSFAFCLFYAMIPA
jgi:hypothetical protein